MDYLVKYKDGFVIGASGDSPAEAMESAAAATARAEDSIDQITERHSTAVIYDCTRGWLAQRSGARKAGDLVDINTGELVDVAWGFPPTPAMAEKPVEVVKLGKSSGESEAPASEPTPAPTTSETPNSGGSSDPDV